MPRYDFWTHGTNVVTEWPQKLRGEQRSGFGTRLEQESEPDKSASFNWFHFPIPTPTVADDLEKVALRYLFLRARTNENARVAQITCHQDGGNRIHDEALEDFLSGEIDHRSGSLSGTIRSDVGGSIVLCARVEFLSGSPLGAIDFLGAGARFDA